MTLKIFLFLILKEKITVSSPTWKKSSDLMGFLVILEEPRFLMFNDCIKNKELMTTMKQ